MAAFLVFIGALVAIPAVVAISSIIRGWVLTILWGWFIVPIFHLPSLLIPQAIGISLVVGFLTQKYHENKKSSCEIEKSGALKTWEFVNNILLLPLFILGIGWVVHRFV